MRFGWLSIAAIGVIAHITSFAAYAADLAPAPSYVKAPVVAPAYSWSGCYLGVNGGYGWNNGNTGYRNDPNAPNADPINFVPDPNGFTEQYIPAPRAGGSGGLGGGGAGCNWQSQQWVLGIEADIDAAHIFGSRNNVNAGGQFGIGPSVYTSINNTGTATEQVSLQWLSTFRARGGITVLDRTLLYVTGGLAVGGVSTQGSVTTSSPFPGFANPAWAGSSATVKVGGVIGAGAEWAFHDHWTVKAEYLWYDLGSVSHPLNCTGYASCSNGIFYATLGNASSSVFGSVVRVGLNYKFGAP